MSSKPGFPEFAPGGLGITVAQFDEKFDAGEDIVEHLDLRTASVLAAGEERLERANPAVPEPEGFEVR